MIAIELPPEVEKELDRRAREKGQTTSDYAREALIERLADAQDVEYLADPSSAVPFSVIKAELGL
jgi:RHH-type rel operon transcriptional repressor/antitoxin RelB